MAKTITVHCLYNEGARRGYFPTIKAARAHYIEQGWKSRSCEIEPVEIEATADGLCEVLNSFCDR